MTANALDDLCRGYRVLALYLFGSRADDGRRRLAGEAVAASGSDLDVAVLFEDSAAPFRRLVALQVALEDVFAPLRVDLLPLQRVDPLVQFAAIDGLRIATPRHDPGRPVRAGRHAAGGGAAADPAATRA